MAEPTPSFAGEVQSIDLKASGIYAIRHICGRLYVGSAVHFGKRWRRHCTDLQGGVHHSVLLQRAWDKYGAEEFEFQVLEYVSDRSELLVREQFYIDSLRSCDPSFGFNISPTAGSTLGRKMSEDALAKQRLRMSQNHPMKGRSHTEESRAKMSASRKGVKRGPRPEEFKRRMSAIAMGRVISEAQRQQIAAALRGRKVPAEIVKKVALANTGKKRTADTKRRIAESNSKTKIRNQLAVVRWAFYAD